MKINAWLISILIGALVFVALFSVYLDMNTNYARYGLKEDETGKVDDLSAQMNETLEQSNKMSDTMRNRLFKNDSSIVDRIESFTQLSLGSLMLTFDLNVYVIKVLNTAMGIMNIPNWVAGVIISIIGLSIVFAIFYMFYLRKV